MNSPFKFLDAYGQNDRSIFFGREEEIERLYRLVFEANLVLVYGQSGTGKTSLIQCGLANRFQPTDWFQLFVRRQENINLALDREIRAHALTEIPAGAPIVDAVRSLYLDHLRPIYLIFDQFEELFILGSADEQAAFSDTIAALHASDLSCKVIISLREEYLAMLHRFEKAVPTLFEKRLRVEPMSMANVRRVILGTTGALGIALEHGEETAQRIIDNLEDPRAGVQLAYLQVYLDQLYRRAAGSGGDRIVFTDQAVEETGTLGDLMEDFLDEQVAAIQAELVGKNPGVDKDAVRQVLEQFATLEGTKQPMTRADVAAQLPALQPWIEEMLAALQNARILRCTEPLFELAHDSLAGRIAERRSGESKALLMVRKLVSDRMAAFDQTKTWLNRDELAIVRRSRPILELTDAEAQFFVARSASKARWSRIRWVSGLAVTAAGLLFLIVIAGLSSLETEDTYVRALHDSDRLAREYHTGLTHIDGTEEIRTDLLRQIAENNDNLTAISTAGNAGDRFWTFLVAADLKWEAGNVDEARSDYVRMLQAVNADLDDLPLLRRVKAQALLTRLVQLEEEQGPRVARLRELIAALSEPNDNNLVRFERDRVGACELLRDLGADSPHCPTS